MSHPIPTEERFLTHEDLDNYLKSLDKSIRHYTANKVIHKNNPEEVAYANKMLKKLDLMAVHAIARFHNQ